MGIGSILVGVALALGVGAYLAQPFRRGRVDLDRAIETWVSQVRAGGESKGVVEAVKNPDHRSGLLPRKKPLGAAAPKPPLAIPPQPQAGASWLFPVNYCPRCGRRAGPGDRFCAGCGRPLPGEEG
jgi:hypothetical protein